MKKLTGIRLVNWHAFQNETIHIHNSVMLSGENGAGKSTILDAIQYVLTCDKRNFNKAANDSSKRNLEGYVRYKTGKEEKAFERIGNVTSHVALEFYEERKREHSVIGVVIDSASETSSKSFFYRIEGQKIDNIEFLEKNNSPKDISRFKVYGRDFKIQGFNNPTQAKEDFTNRLGNFNKKFFELLPKALAFKPIGNVKEFVYSYILDEKEVNIDDLRQNIRTYREFEELLEEVKLKISKLDYIKASYDQYQNHVKNEKLQGYIILRAEEEKLLVDLEKLKKELEKHNLKLKSVEEQYDKVGKYKSDKEELKSNIVVDLNSNGDYQAVKGLEGKINELKEKHKELDREKNEFKKLLETQKNNFKFLGNNYDDDGVYQEYFEALRDLTHENSDDFLVKSNEMESYTNKKDVILRDEKAALILEQKELNKQSTESKTKISELKKRNLQYPQGVRELREIIIEESQKDGKKINPKIICEILEITNPLWTNAIEGYLNTQRFYFLVEKNEFDRALRIYERYRKKNNLYNVGIINVAGLEKYDECEENSLADIVTSKSKDAKRFINFILGKVVRCETVEELKNYKTSITPTCMVYKNNVARAIDPKIYCIPYIGAEAYKVQLEAEESNFEILTEKLESKNSKISVVDGYISALSGLKIENLKYKQGILKKIHENKVEIENKENEKKDLDKNSSYMDLTMKLCEIEEELKNYTKKLDELDDYKVKIRTDISLGERDIESTESCIKAKKIQSQNYKEEIGELVFEGEERLANERRIKSLTDIISNFNGTRIGTATRIKNTEESLKDKMREYNNAYSLGAEIGVEGINKFLAALYDLEKSKVIEYEEKVKDAKRNADEEFKHHFIAKLKANIDSAKAEFKELDRGLKGIYFGNEAYEFKIGKNNELNKYHDMVMDDENIVDGFNLFTEMYQSKYKELLDELFERLTLDDGNSEAELRKFTDYRNYMDYDIKINYRDGSHALFSKVSREKSGGETQTPYYVVIAASFLQLYNSSTGRETIGLILFDEAFDKMDDARIVAMMEFFKKLELQVIIASPPQKIEAIAPYVNTTLLAMKLGKFSVIEELKQDEL